MTYFSVQCWVQKPGEKTLGGGNREASQVEERTEQGPDNGTRTPHNLTLDQIYYSCKPKDFLPNYSMNVLFKIFFLASYTQLKYQLSHKPSQSPSTSSSVFPQHFTPACFSSPMVLHYVDLLTWAHHYIGLLLADRTLFIFPFPKTRSMPHAQQELKKAMQTDKHDTYQSLKKKS